MGLPSPRVLALILLTYPAFAAGGDFLDVATYESASGAYALRVVPSDRKGAGEAAYSLSRNGDVVWSKKAPLTLWNAAVADDGTVGGYAYSTGDGIRRDPGEFVIARIDASGTLQALFRQPRGLNPRLHARDLPLGTEVLIDEPNARFVVGVLPEGGTASRERAFWSFPLMGDAPKTDLDSPPFDLRTTRSKVLDYRSWRRPSSDDAPLRQITPLAAFRITSTDPAQSQTVRDVIVDATGRVGLLASPECTGDSKVAATIRVVSDDGTIERQVGLPAAPCDDAVPVIAAGDAHWWVAQPDGSTRATVSRFDPAHGTLVAVDEYDGAQITALAGLGEGFVALIRQHDERLGEPVVLRAYDRDGRERWRSDGANVEYDINDGAIAAVTPAGTIVVLEIGAPELLTFDPDGRFLGRRSLATAWGRTPSFPVHVSPGEGDSVVVQDFEGRHAAVHLSLDGAILAEFSPMSVDGRRPRIVRGVHPARTGGYWMSDGRALLRLDVGGRVTSTIGDAADDDRLSVVAGIAITRDGLVHAVDERTGAVHVLDADARTIRICYAEPGDVDGTSAGEISASANGGIVVQHAPAGEAAFRVQFDGHCQRVGTVDAVVAGDESQSWFAHQDDDSRWVRAEEAIHLVRGKQVVRTIDRTAEGYWLAPEDVAVAPDGAIVVASSASSAIETGLRPLIATFSPAGSALAAWPAPQGYRAFQSVLAFDGSHVVVVLGDDRSRKAQLLAMSATGTPLFRFESPAGRAIVQMAFVKRAEGSELWTFDGIETIHRFEWPPALR